MTRGSIYLRLVELEERNFTQFDIMRHVRNILLDYPDLRTVVSDVSAIGGGAGGDSRVFQISLQGPEITKLSEYADQLKSRLRELPGLVDVDSTLSVRKPELQVNIDRDRASDLDIRLRPLPIPCRSWWVDKSYPATKRAWSNTMSGCARNALIVPALWSWNALPCHRLQPARCSLVTSPLCRSSKVPAKSTDSIGNAPSRLWSPRPSLAHEAVQFANKAVEEMKLPPGYGVVVGGQGKMLAETGYYFVVALALSTTFMYLILAAQFESWILSHQYSLRFTGYHSVWSLVAAAVPNTA